MSFTKKLAIGFVFAAIGLGVFVGLTLPRILLYFKMKNAVAVPVTEIVSLELEHHERSKLVKCTFRYRVNDATYTSDRVMIFETRSGIHDSFNRDLYESLKSFRDNPERSGSPPTCFVSKSSPKTAVLIRDFRLSAWGFVVVPIAFILAGLVVIFLSIRYRRLSED